MPCNSNAELPSGVRSSLSESDQSKWREVYNSALEQYGDQETAARVAWAAVKKSSDSMRWFDGWISVEKVDSQGDKLCIKETHKAVNTAIARGGIIIEEHTNRPVGAIFNAEMAEHPKGMPGLYGQHVIFQGEPLYDQVWEEVKKGGYNGLSIAGYPYKGEEKTVCDANKCWNEVGKMHIFEISVCKNPANHDSLITQVNAKAKAQENDVSDKEEKKDDELPTEDRPQASVIQEVLQKILALVSDVHAKVTAPKPTEEPPEEKKPEEKPVEGETAEEPEEKKDVSKMEKSEIVKEEPKPTENKQKIEQPVMQPTQPAPVAPPVQVPPPTNPAPIPQPSVTVETPRPGVVEQGSSANNLNDLWKDPVILKKLSMREISRLYHPK